MCFQNGGRPPSWILAEVKSGGISVSGTSVVVSLPNFMRICGIATELWPLKWIFQMAAAAILDFSEVKLDVTGSHVSTSTPNLVKISQRAAELWRFMCFQNGGRPPSWILAEVKFGDISVSRTSVLVSMPNFIWIRGIATELWPLNWIFKNLTSPKVAGDPYLPPHQIGEDISKGGRVMAVFVFSKWRPPPSWIYFRCRFFSYRRFWTVAGYVPAKFHESTSSGGWVNFWGLPKNSKWRLSAILNYFWLRWTTHEAFLLTGSLCSNFVSIGFMFPKISPIEHFASLA